ncbi:MAG TPA: TIGR02221 family CRISPR-associated protein [Armatimonadetes bacterium]|nr:TIGR02221 family CRISPR-associated protein [Armatimonadota bacterium]
MREVARVAVSFIGVGRLSEDPSKRGYLRTVYQFPDGSREEATFFGAAFLRWLERKNLKPQRWLVMGTSRSMWDALYGVLPSEAQERLLDENGDLWQEVFQAKEEGKANQAIIDRWEAVLRGYLHNLDLRLRVVGAAESEDSQMRMWQELASAVEEGARVFLDITHGFRHQPALAAFMMIFLRWLKGIEDFELFYGAFEMAKGKDAPCPVIHLSLCNLLARAAEAMAIFRTTGNFAPLADILPLDRKVKEKVMEVAYAEETNQQARSTAKEVLRTLDNLEVDPVRAAVADVLRETLEWAKQEGLSQRMMRKAKFALEHGQYLKAIILLYEALLVKGCQLYRTGDSMTWKARRAALQCLKERLQPEDVKVLCRIESLRNAVVHGGRGQKAEIQQALRSSSAFERIFKEGERLLARLKEG